MPPAVQVRANWQLIRRRGSCSATPRSSGRISLLESRKRRLELEESQAHASPLLPHPPPLLPPLLPPPQQHPPPLLLPPLQLQHQPCLARLRPAFTA